MYQQEKMKREREREREWELERDVQTMINTECLICQNSWTFLTMIKKTLGKINNTFSFHHIWILLLLKENDFSWIHSWFVLFKDIISRHFMIFHFRFFCSLRKTIWFITFYIWLYLRVDLYSGFLWLVSIFLQELE